ncbi:MAG: CAAX prenyl protease-related protein [Bryobacteraceae bacterium]
MPVLERYPSVRYIAPFVVFLVFLLVDPYNPLPDRLEYPLRVAILSAVIWFVSRGVISFRIANLSGSLLLGVAVFAVWIAPDLLVPGWRQHWLFQNSITGTLKSSLSEAARGDVFILSLRSLRAVVLVPIIEELFWRGWMMRWIIDPDFRKIALGSFSALSFWLTALLFASEHSSYWEVGLVAGIAYNWWMLRTRSLGDCILAHAVTNACLCLFVVVTGKWEYWL